MSDREYLIWGERPPKRAKGGGTDWLEDLPTLTKSTAKIKHNAPDALAYMLRIGEFGSDMREALGLV